jgi:hypothetical protein
MGSTVNHIAAVGVPVVGGLLWSTVGYQVTFLAGAATCLLSVLSALAIRAEHAPSAQRITCEQLEGPPIAAMVAADGHAEGPAGPSPALSVREKQQVHERRLLGE